MHLRISGGELRGRRLQGPRRGSEMRPTTERVREAVFSILGDVGGARVLDLFCGTRGARAGGALARRGRARSWSTRIRRWRSATSTSWSLGDRAEVVRSDALRWLDRAPESSFDLVLCDPPYGLVRPPQR